MAASPVAVVRKALDVLEHLGLKGDAGESHLSRELRLPLATVRRLLATLCAAGYVLQNPSTQDYRLSTRVLDLSASVLGRLNVRTDALPFMQSLAAGCRETLNLAAPTVRMPIARVPEAAAVVVVKIAAEISRQLGFCPWTGPLARSGPP
jgi:DNA-binding IclR family transcriptional regulator